MSEQAGVEPVDEDIETCDQDIQPDPTFVPEEVLADDNAQPDA